MKRLDIEEMILGMADLVHENRSLRKQIQEYELKIVRHEAVLWGKKSLAQKLSSQIMENHGSNLMDSMNCYSSEEWKGIDNMDLTEEEYNFCISRLQ